MTRDLIEHIVRSIEAHANVVRVARTSGGRIEAETDFGATLIVDVDFDWSGDTEIICEGPTPSRIAP